MSRSGLWREDSAECADECSLSAVTSEGAVEELRRRRASDELKVAIRLSEREKTSEETRERERKRGARV